MSENDFARDVISVAAHKAEVWVYASMRGEYAERYLGRVYVELDEAKAVEGEGRVRWREEENGDWWNGLSDQASVYLERVELLGGNAEAKQLEIDCTP